MRRTNVSALLLCVTTLLFLLVSRQTAAQTLGPGLIEAPPTVIGSNESIGSDTTLNVYDGGMVGAHFVAGSSDDSGSNIFVNVHGGTIGNEFAARHGTTLSITGGVVGDRLVVTRGAVVDILGGTIGDRFFVFNSTVNISGGTIGESFELQGSVVNISGGTIGNHFRPRSESIVDISGGAFGDFQPSVGTSLKISGGEFKIDGLPIEGLESIGNELMPHIPANAVLSGIFADGTPFVFPQFPSGASYHLAPLLAVTDLPDIGPELIDAGSDPVPLGVREGQTIIVGMGAIVPAYFQAGIGSTVNISGGSVGENLDAEGAQINLSSGEIGREFKAFNGTEVNITGGSIGDLSRAFSGSTINMFAGAIESGFDAYGDVNVYGGTIVDHFDAMEGSVVHFSGGVHGSFIGASSGSEVNISGGSFGALFRANDGSVVRVSGGSFFDGFETEQGSAVEFAGDDFRINGEPIQGLESIGDSQPVSIAHDDLLTGTYLDGTPFAFVYQSNSPFFDGTPRENDEFSDGTLTLIVGQLPEIATGVINSATDPVPLGIRAGQTLQVDDGSAVPSNFMAGPGSVVNVAGGTVGPNFEAIDAEVNISDGSVNFGADAFGVSTFNVTGGNIDGTFEAYHGSTINIHDGSVEGMRAYGAIVNIHGGDVTESLKVADGSSVVMTGGVINDWLYANQQSDVTVTGGVVDLLYLDGSDARISGGAIGGLRTRLSATDAVFVGGEFRLDGVPIDGLVQNGDSLRVEVPSGSLLSGTLADGTPFAVVNKGGSEEISSFSRVWVELSDLAPVGPPTIDLATDPAPLGIRNGQEVLVTEGSALENHFMAGVGSRISMTGGSVGENLRAVGTEVEISGGTVGDEFHALHGTVANISGGSIGNRFQAYSGSTVNVSGGNIGHGFDAREGSVVNISGGKFTYSESVYDGNLDAMDGSVVNITGGLVGVGLRVYDDSAVTISGDGFRVDGMAVADLENEGDTIAIDVPEGSVLTGTLTDGTPLVFSRLPGNSFAGGMLTLRESAIVDQPPMIVASVDPIPLGVSEGRTLSVDAGSEVPEELLAGWGSKVIVQEGGNVGPGLRAYGAELEISGGTLGNSPQFDTGTSVVVTGGSIGENASISNDAILTISNGLIGSTFKANDGSTVNIRGGTFGDHFDANSGSVVNISGGTVGDEFEAYSGSVVNLSGGTFSGVFDAHSGSTLNFFGFSLLLDGQPIDGLALDEALVIADRNRVLSGRWADGSEFSYYLGSSSFRDFYVDRNATLTVTLVSSMLDGDFNNDGIVDLADYTVWRDNLGSTDESGIGYAGDGFAGVDAADYQLWNTNFGLAVGAQGINEAQAVPEPSAAVLMASLIASVGAFWLHRPKSTSS